MLFQANPYLWSFQDLTLNELLEVTDILAHSSPQVRPIFECVKIYVKLDESGNVAYARHQNDFLGVDKHVIIERIKDLAVADAIEEALDYVESTISSFWPFRPGSTTWCLLEILDPRINIAAAKNFKKIIIREAVRIDLNGNCTRSSLLERMFSRMKKDIEQACDQVYIIDPITHLRNVSGTGIYTELKADLVGLAALEGGLDLTIGSLTKASQKYLQESLKQFSDELFLGNADTILSEAGFFNTAFSIESFPGVNVQLDDLTFRMSGSFIKQKEEVMLEKKKAKKLSFPPLFGWRS